jgi:uncharacterized membrane protein
MPLDFISIIIGIAAIILAVTLPGYALSLALFPRKEDLDNFERIAIMFVLSIAVPSLVILAENQLLKIAINLASVLATYVAITALGFLAYALRRSKIQK